MKPPWEVLSSVIHHKTCETEIKSHSQNGGSWTLRCKSPATYSFCYSFFLTTNRPKTQYQNVDAQKSCVCVAILLTENRANSRDMSSILLLPFRYQANYIYFCQNFVCSHILPARQPVPYGKFEGRSTILRVMVFIF